MCWYMSDAIVLQASRPRAWSALAVGCLLLMLLSGKQSYASQRESLWKELEELPSEVYFLPGDVNIGTIQVVRDYDETTPCGSGVSRFGELQLLLATIWAVKLINSSPDILPNVTLGLVGLDHCYKSATAVGQAWRLLTGLGAGPDTGEWPRIMGVVGPVHSVATIATANVFTLFHVPQVSPTATSDELSDRVTFPDLYRVVPPGSFVASTMVDLMKHFGWSYVTVLYEENTYGFNDFKYLRKIARPLGICIGEVHPLSDGFTDGDYDDLLGKLYQGLRQETQAVVVFAFKYKLSALFSAVRRLNPAGRFLWLLSETAYLEVFNGVEEELQGAITISWRTGTNTALKSYMENLTPGADVANPWLPLIWRQYFPCQPNNTSDSDAEGYRTGRSSDSCVGDYRVGDLPGFSYYPSANTSVDSVVVFAKALDTYIRERCPLAFENVSLLTPCLDRRLFGEYVRNVTIDTADGTLRFADSGAMIRDYRITQLQNTNGRWTLAEIGTWSATNQNVEVYWDRLQWYSNKNVSKTQMELRAEDLMNTLWNRSIPASICSKPCEPGEFLIHGELSCCWDCRKCRSNEIVTRNGTACTECPATTWPDPETVRTCAQIPPHHLTWLHPYGLGLVVLAGIGFIIVLLTIGFVIRNKDHKVIKGACREMITVILIGLCLTFLTIPTFVAKPHPAICPMTRMGFSVSCTLIFGPLLVKTNRVYQVFAASAKLSRKVRMAGQRLQYMMTVVVILIQVAITTVAAVVWPTEPIITMPIATAKYVELHCQQDQLGLLLPLSYNLLLIFACSIFAFLTRKLPGNFNESWHIFLSVCTTLFIWVAFLPTYYVTFYAYHKAALLAFAMILNGVVTVVCFFVPKIYAVFYVDEKDIKVANFDESEFATSVESRRSSAAVTNGSVQTADDRLEDNTYI